MLGLLQREVSSFLRLARAWLHKEKRMGRGALLGMTKDEALCYRGFPPGATHSQLTGGFATMTGVQCDSHWAWAVRMGHLKLAVACLREQGLACDHTEKRNISHVNQSTIGPIAIPNMTLQSELRSGLHLVASKQRAKRIWSRFMIRFSLISCRLLSPTIIISYTVLFPCEIK